MIFRLDMVPSSRNFAKMDNLGLKILSKFDKDTKNKAPEHARTCALVNANILYSTLVRSANLHITESKVLINILQ